jgi:hypothetical protein
MRNRTFSITKDRELSSLEGRIGSIKRRLRNPLGRRSLKVQAIPTTLRVSIYFIAFLQVKLCSALADTVAPTNQESKIAMPRKRGQGKDDYLETIDTEESYGNNLGGDSSRSRISAGEVDERSSSNDNDCGNNVNDSYDRTNNSNIKCPVQGKRLVPFQHEVQHGLGSWSQAIKGTVQSLEPAHRALKGLQDKLTMHIDDLNKMEKNTDRLRQLEEEREKLESTVTTLKRMDRIERAGIETQQAEIKREKQELDQEKAKQEKRVSMKIAEERVKLKIEFEKLVMQQDESHNKRKKELEDEFSKHKEGNGKRIAIFETERNKLRATAKERESTIEIQTVKLGKLEEQYDILERAKNSFKKEKEDLATEIETMKKEFALNPNPISYLYVFWGHSSHQGRSH